jgi:restriction endonuclease S subunit
VEEREIGEVFNIIMGQSPPGESYNRIEEGTVFYQVEPILVSGFLKIECIQPPQIGWQNGLIP